ncbi:imidazole glycerol phosphate synthase subunit HisH [Gracilimonas mengyeensis]|uniref:Imidazole glycerol phosphate synthase subunit HisH n=1 Tax=Gracilimonas mengyeensis TaxID=1302730 RepID=A0A521DFD5_9BACT|nr:imidazole glycerol phosphate synthase subunit HisH [Gracilimonas mengyeensis]SMO70292.1 glutamine amidotransferase [Gracilimonas mengyeensis]
MIAIIKYKAGNTASVANALERLGTDYYLAETPDELNKADGIIFPGVGHAGAAMQSLKDQKIDTWLKNTEKPVLGICVGMQLLYETSSEGNTVGLGIIDGGLEKFDESQAKVPHMGWNRINLQVESHPILRNIIPKHYLYFVHSYYAPVSEDTLAACNYINDFTAIVAKDNFIGVQFHPEKSGNVGSLILQNFLDMVYSPEKVKA